MNARNINKRKEKEDIMKERKKEENKENDEHGSIGFHARAGNMLDHH